MPRYQQPRIAATEIKGVPTDFKTLGAENFDPASIRPLIKACRDWISAEEQNLDPTVGVEDSDQADREREKFRKDIANYTREANRIELGIDLLDHAFKHFRAEPGCREALPYRAWFLLNQTFREAGLGAASTSGACFSSHSFSRISPPSLLT